MSFLAPLFWLGALAVALPVLFHLIRQTTRDQRPFSSLMFLAPTPPRATRRSRLEHLLLLALRCLAISLLAAAFARPFIDRPFLRTPAAAVAKSTVLLIDTSASMQRDDLWSAALAAAKATLQAAAPEDLIAVLTFDRTVQTLVGFDQWRAMAPPERAPRCLDALQALSPGWSGTQLGHALVTAAELLADERKAGTSSGSRQIVVVTDLQEGSRLDSLQGYEWPRGVRVAIERLKARRTTNAGVQWVADAGGLDAANTDPALRLRIGNSADARREQFQIRWDGPAAVPTLDAYVPPGQSRILRLPAPPEGADATRILLTGDDERFDNTVFVIPPRPERLEVLILTAEAEQDPTQCLYYLRRALQSTRGFEVQATVLRAADTPSPAALATARVMVAIDSLPELHVALARRFLDQGGTLLFVLKGRGAAATLSALLDRPGTTASEATVGQYALLGQIDFEHPLFAPFADPRYSDFTKIHFWKHRRLSADTLPGARVLARFDDGDPALLELPTGNGRVLVLTSGWHPADSQFALSSRFVPWLYSLIELSGGLSAPVFQCRVGEEMTLSRPGRNPPTAVLRPDGRLIPLATGTTRFSQTDQPGLYRVTAGETAWRFAVNLDAAESRTAPLPLDALAQFGVPLAPSAPATATTRPEQQLRIHRTELENRQKFWRVLLGAAFGVLVLESWLAGWLTRRTLNTDRSV